MKKRAMFLLWLGAAISISEIFTGGLLAPLGLGKGLLAILIGHIIGVSLLAWGGYISFSRRQNAMESVAFSLGSTGGALVALANVLQLIGWTVVMIVQAGSALAGILPAIPFVLLALVLSFLVLLWALIFGSPAARLNEIVVILLSLLCLALFAEAATAGSAAARGIITDEVMSMALAIELSIAMPVSWLPLIGDYSLRAKNKSCATAMPFAGYFLGSCLMYGFGLYIGVATGLDIFAFIAQSRFSLVACGVVLLSTLTTAFLDLYSAAMSSTRLVKNKNIRASILAIGLAAALISAFFPVERYGQLLTGFLTAIGMVFVPVYSVVFLDFLLRRPASRSSFPRYKLFCALTGMAAYMLFSRLELWIPTLLSIIVVALLYLPYTIIKREGN